MEHKSLSRAKTLIRIPIVVFAVIAVCLCLASALSSPAGKGAAYSLFALIGMLGIFLTPLPCLAVSVGGTVYAAKAAKEGIASSRKYLAAGIAEIPVYVAGAILAVAMFIGGKGV